MADKMRKLPKNVSGPWYVDEDCDDCSLCSEIAPGIFFRNEDAGQSFVGRQPEDDDEISQCEEAADSCPSECIGSDG
jgi:ferredoxin